jgi:hypothetical protein
MWYLRCELPRVDNKHGGAFFFSLISHPTLLSAMTENICWGGEGNGLTLQWLAFSLEIFLLTLKN